MREIILDTETTGLDPKSGHRIIEIGMLEVKNKVLTGNEFHKFINPNRDVSLEAYRIHGISTEFLLDKPVFAEIVDEFLDFIEDTQLVIHNANFDIKFINHELSLLSKPSIDTTNVVDTLKIARKTFPGAKVSLDALCKRFKIDNSSRLFHGAILDARLLYEIYVELVGGIQNSLGIASVSIKDAEEIDHQLIQSHSKINTVVIKPDDYELEVHKGLLLKLNIIVE